MSRFDHDTSRQVCAVAKGDVLGCATHEADCKVLMLASFTHEVYSDDRDELRLPGFVLCDSFMTLSSSFISKRACVVGVPPLLPRTVLISFRSSDTSSGWWAMSYKLCFIL